MKKIIFAFILFFTVGICLQAQISDVIKIGGTSADTASLIGATAYPWHSSEFYSHNKLFFAKVYFDIDTVGTGKAKYRITVEERPDGTIWYPVTTSTYGNGGWTKGDTTWALSTQTSTTSPPFATKYYRYTITPYDSVQKIKISGYQIIWPFTK